MHARHSKTFLSLPSALLCHVMHAYIHRLPVLQEAVPALSHEHVPAKHVSQSETHIITHVVRKDTCTHARTNACTHAYKCVCPDTKQRHITIIVSVRKHACKCLYMQPKFHKHQVCLHTHCVGQNTKLHTPARMHARMRHMQDIPVQSVFEITSGEQPRTTPPSLCIYAHM